MRFFPEIEPDSTSCGLGILLFRGQWQICRGAIQFKPYATYGAVTLGEHVVVIAILSQRIITAIPHARLSDSPHEVQARGEQSNQPSMLCDQ